MPLSGSMSSITGSSHVSIAGTVPTGSSASPVSLAARDPQPSAPPMLQRRLRLSHPSFVAPAGGDGRFAVLPSEAADFARFGAGIPMIADFRFGGAAGAGAGARGAICSSTAFTAASDTESNPFMPTSASVLSSSKHPPVFQALQCSSSIIVSTTAFVNDCLAGPGDASSASYTASSVDFTSLMSIGGNVGARPAVGCVPRGSGVLGAR
mmetsp:Transcript_7616/g.19692  ORF Transcript_7616/g.19692 Transcript_7616/m.19692 type:complete len:209 (+) Transcript_7616:209-835(+)